MVLAFQRSQGRIVVRLFGDFVHQLAVNNLVIFINTDHRPRGQTGQRTGCNGDTVIGQELRSAQRGQGDDIVQAFRAS